jgi:phosphoribosylformylglycinamidine synthase
LAKCNLGEVIPNEPAKLLAENNQNFIFSPAVLNKYNELRKTDFEIIQEEQKIFELPPEKLSNREAIFNLMKRPNIASKRWLKYHLEQFSGNNNFNVNFYAGLPLALCSSGQAIGFGTQINTEYFTNGLKEGIIRNFLEIMRKMASVNLKASEAQICFMVNPETFTPEIEAQAYGLSAHAGKELSIQIKTSFSFQKDFFFYNQPFLPIIGMTGKLPGKQPIHEFKFKNKGDMIFLVGKTKESLSAEYLQEVYGQEKPILPELSIQDELKTIQIVHELLKKALVKTVYNVSPNGLLVSLIEACVPGRFGFDITTDAEIRTDIFLFSNSDGRFILTVDPENIDGFIDFMAGNQYPFTTLGHVTKEELRIDDISFGFINDIRKIFLKSLEEKFNNN